MPKLGEIERKGSQLIETPLLPWLTSALHGGLARGGIYLLSGGPGAGKTTLANELLGDLASQGRKVLYVTTEQSLGEFKTALERVHGRNGNLPSTIVQNFYVDDELEDIGDLAKFVGRRLLPVGGPYHDTEIMVIDSVQGRGLSSNASKKYSALYEFTALARGQGLTVVLVAHVTKNGLIAGPRSLEHAVDCVMCIRRAFKLRLFFVTKNRFAPDLVEPIPLTMDERGRLVQSRLTSASQISVFGYSGFGDELSEAQVSLAIPKFGYRAQLLAPFLPRERLRQIMTVLSRIPEVDLDDLTYHVNCYLPRQRRYNEQLDMPLAVAMIASFLRRPVRRDALFVGELDLTGRIRAPQDDYLGNLGALLLASPAGKRIRTTFASREIAGRLGRFQLDKSGPCLADAVQIKSVSDVEEVFDALWPDLRMQSSPARVASAR